MEVRVLGYGIDVDFGTSIVFLFYMFFFPASFANCNLSTHQLCVS